MSTFYNYTGNSIPVFLRAGNYYIELWGAQGSYDANNIPALGSYVSGMLSVKKSSTFYLFIGEKGRTKNYTFNGGGQGQFTGGGSSDLRLVDGPWYNSYSLISRIIVAAGAGGPDSGKRGGDGGSLIGFNSEDNYGKGGTQTSGGDGYVKGGFGIGGGNDIYGLLGNGGGGGGSSSNPNDFGGGGGSSFISGYPGCYAVLESIDPIIHSNQSIHYSGYYFQIPNMIDGRSQMPSPSGGLETGHSGDGFAIITIMNSPSGILSQVYSLLSFELLFTHIILFILNTI